MIGEVRTQLSNAYTAAEKTVITQLDSRLGIARLGQLAATAKRALEALEAAADQIKAEHEANMAAQQQAKESLLDALQEVSDVAGGSAALSLPLGHLSVAYGNTDIVLGYTGQLGEIVEELAAKTAEMGGYLECVTGTTGQILKGIDDSVQETTQANIAVNTYVNKL